MKIPVPFIAMALILSLTGSVTAEPNYAFLACKFSSEIFRMSLDEPGYPMTLFADAGDGLHYPWAMAYHPDPQDPAYPNTDHLYVGGESGGNIVKLIIDRDTGEKVAAVPFGYSPGIRSLAFEPRTNRLYGGTHNFIYRYAADGSGYEVVVQNTPYLYDECQIAFHPETGDLYVATGFYNHIMVFSPADWGNPWHLESYDSDFWYLPQNLLFVNVGSEWQLFEHSYRKGTFPYFSLLRFDPINDVFLGVECYEQLGVTWNIDRCWETGDYYAGVIDYPSVRRISSDFSTVTVIKDHPATSPPFPHNGTLTIATWPPRPLDSDGDCLPDAWENAEGLNPDDTDTDGDGIRDSVEVGYDGDYDDYSPYPAGGDMNAGDPDTDGGGEDDGVEIGKGRDPVDPGDDDNDDDGVPNVTEDTIGTDRDDADSDDDGYTDYEEIARDGDPTSYTPGSAPDSDTDPRSPDSDGDGYSDMVEIAGGYDPNDDESKPGVIKISFQPSGSSRHDGYAPDSGWLYDSTRRYGWID